MWSIVSGELLSDINPGASERGELSGSVITWIGIPSSIPSSDSEFEAERLRLRLRLQLRLTRLLIRSSSISLSARFIACVDIRSVMGRIFSHVLKNITFGSFSDNIYLKFLGQLCGATYSCYCSPLGV